MFRFLVLGLLRSGESFHGYALMKAYRERSGLQLSTGSFYRELQRLVAEGCVRTADNPANADPRRAPYQITDTGAAAFDAWLTGPTGPGLGRYDDELSSRAIFLDGVDLPVARKLLDGWKEELWIRGKMCERSRGLLINQHCDDPLRSFRVLESLVARTLKHITADLEFLEEFGAAYEDWATNARASNPGRKRTASTLPLRRPIRSKEPDGRR